MGQANRLQSIFMGSEESVNKKTIGFLMVALVFFSWISNEIRGNFVSIRSVAFDEFHYFLEQQGIAPTLFKGPYLDLTNQKYFVFNWYHISPSGTDTVSVTVHVPVYFSSLRSDVGGNGDFKSLIGKTIK